MAAKTHQRTPDPITAASVSVRAMGDANVEIAKRCFDAFNRRDFDAFGALCDPAVTWRWGGDFFESDASGFAEVRTFLERWIETFPAVRVACEQVFGSGDVLVFFLKQSGAGAASGAPSELEFAQTITFANGLVQDICNYLNRDEAIEAAGLAD